MEWNLIRYLKTFIAQKLSLFDSSFVSYRIHLKQIKQIIVDHIGNILNRRDKTTGMFELELRCNEAKMHRVEFIAFNFVDTI